MAAQKDRLIQAAELLGMHPEDLLDRLTSWGWHGTPDDPETGEARDRGPAPEGLAVIAHWSAVHAGVNIEIDAPEGLPLTVHVNDWRAVDIVVGAYGETVSIEDEREAAQEMILDMIHNSPGTGIEWQREHAEALMAENFPHLPATFTEHLCDSECGDQDHWHDGRTMLVLA